MALNQNTILSIKKQVPQAARTQIQKQFGAAFQKLKNKMMVEFLTPMPWAPGRSWARGIERGISGLGYYLKIKTDNSRSGLGIQSSRKVRKSSSKFKNMQYISALLKKYKKEFENLQLP